MSYIVSDLPENYNGVSGLISLAVDAGLPLDLVLPIEPPYLNLPLDDERRQRSGKTPATFRDGDWIGLKDWPNRTIHPEVLRDAGRDGCNVGVKLGVPSQEPSGLHLLALDLDLNDGQEDACKTLLDALQPLLGGIFFTWRDTRPGRALCLIHLTGLFDSHKRVWQVVRRGDGWQQDIGKIELLAGGQQCIVAGRHWSGREILRHCAGRARQCVARATVESNPSAEVSRPGRSCDDAHRRLAVAGRSWV